MRIEDNKRKEIERGKKEGREGGRERERDARAS
jgi:hypothetical protein